MIRQTFDLPLMKRLLGAPVLLGTETVQNFDDFIIAMAESLEPGDMVAHVLVYQYAMEAWLNMRLRRLQGHLIQLYSMSVDNHEKLAKTLKTSDAEAQAFSALQTSHAAQTRVDYLISQTDKRMHSILGQISLHRVALAQNIRMKLDIEERKLKIKELRQTEAKQS